HLPRDRAVQSQQSYSFSCVSRAFPAGGIHCSQHRHVDRRGHILGFGIPHALCSPYFCRSLVIPDVQDLFGREDRAAHHRPPGGKTSVARRGSGASKYLVKQFLLLIFCPILLCAQSKPTIPRVGVVDYYGLHKITPARIQRVLSTKEGDPFPTSKGDIEERLEQIPGVVRSHLEAVCCDDGKAVLFVGIEERGAAHFEFRTPPAGEVRLPGDIVEAYRQFLTAVEAAARNGNASEDLRSGHSLMADPAARLLQQRF